MGPRKLHQQPLYLEPDKALLLDRLAAETSKAKQVLLREAVNDLIKKYGEQGFLKNFEPDMSYFESDEFRARVVRDIRAGAAIDVEALVESGDLVRRGRGWYGLRNVSVLEKVNPLVRSLAEGKAKGKPEIRVQLESAKKWKALAARLKPGL